MEQLFFCLCTFGNMVHCMIHLAKEFHERRYFPGKELDVGCENELGVGVCLFFKLLCQVKFVTCKLSFHCDKYAGK